MSSCCATTPSTTTRSPIHDPHRVGETGCRAHPGQHGAGVKNPFLASSEWGWQIDPVGLASLPHRPLTTGTANRCSSSRTVSACRDELTDEGRIHDPYPHRLLPVALRGDDPRRGRRCRPARVSELGADRHHQRFVVADLEEVRFHHVRAGRPRNGTGERRRKDSFSSVPEGPSPRTGPTWRIAASAHPPGSTETNPCRSSRRC